MQTEVDIVSALQSNQVSLNCFDFVCKDATMFFTFSPSLGENIKVINHTGTSEV